MSNCISEVVKVNKAKVVSEIKVEFLEYKTFDKHI